MIQLISTRDIAKSMLISRYAMRIITLLSAVLFMAYMVTDIMRLGILAMFSYIAAISLETDNKINALRMELRKDKTNDIL